MRPVRNREKGARSRRPQEPEAPPTEIVGQVPPNDLDLEKDVLGACLRDRTAVLQARAVLKPEELFGTDHQIIFEGMIAVVADGHHVDVSSVRSKLKHRGMLDRVGGASYLSELATTRPEGKDVTSAAKRLSELHRLRSIIETGRRIAALGQEAANDIKTFAEGAVRDINKVAYSGRKDVEQLTHIAPTVDVSVAGVRQRSENGSAVSGIATGYKEIDEMTSGLMDGDVWYIAGRPGHGKTSALLGILANITAPLPKDEPIETPEIGAAFFSLEMPRLQIANRLICMTGDDHARISIERWRSGRLRPQDWGPAYAAADKLRKSRLWIDDTPAISLEESEAKLMALKADWEREPTYAGCPTCQRQFVQWVDRGVWYCPACNPDPSAAGAFVVEKRVQLTRARIVGVAAYDYFGLMAGDPNARSREEAMAGVSKGFKTLSKRRKVASLVAAQLNREVEKRNAKERRPQLSDLRETGSLEQDGDTIILLYQAAKYRPNDEKVRGKAEWDIAKQRNGKTGRVTMRYSDWCSRFDDEFDGPPVPRAAPPTPADVAPEPDENDLPPGL